MKKNVLVIALLVSLIGFSQESQEKNNDNQKNNEVKLNGLFLVAGAFEGTYERILNEESGVGISLFLPFDDTIDINYYISPYYRFYFGKKYAKGFFLEGFGMLNSFDEGVYIEYDSAGDVIARHDNGNVTDFALGIGVGGKWVTKNGFIGEINLGVGRNLFGSSDFDYNEYVGKLGITIGYRF
jgi:hypothetical protein